MGALYSHKLTFPLTGQWVIFSLLMSLSSRTKRVDPKPILRARLQRKNIQYTSQYLRSIRGKAKSFLGQLFVFPDELRGCPSVRPTVEEEEGSRLGQRGWFRATAFYLIAALAGSGSPSGLMQGVTKAKRSNTGDRACNVSPIKAT